MRVQPTKQLVSALGLSPIMVKSTYSDSIDKLSEVMESDESISVDQAIRVVNAEFIRQRRDPVLQEEPTLILNGLNCHLEEYSALRALFDNEDGFLSLSQRRPRPTKPKICKSSTWKTLM